MSSNATLGVETRAGKKKRERREATAANGGEAFLGLPNHFVLAHILRSGYFCDPADLARLPSVSSAMRDTVAGTELPVRFEELDEEVAAKLGCLSALQRLQRQGLLSCQENLWEAAARRQLEKLKLLRENNTPWDEDTCAGVVVGGHLEVLQWAHENGCAWNSDTIKAARNMGHLELANWALANGCPE